MLATMTNTHSNCLWCDATFSHRYYSTNGQTQGECWCTLPSVSWTLVDGDTVTDYPTNAEYGAFRGILSGEWFRRLSDGQLVDTDGRNAEGVRVAYRITPEGRSSVR